MEDGVSVVYSDLVGACGVWFLPGRKEAISTPLGMSFKCGDCNSNKVASAGMVNKMPAVIEHKEKQMPRPAAKIKLQLFPLDEEIRRGLEQVDIAVK